MKSQLEPLTQAAAPAIVVRGSGAFHAVGSFSIAAAPALPDRAVPIVDGSAKNEKSKAMRKSAVVVLEEGELLLLPPPPSPPLELSEDNEGNESSQSLPTRRRFNSEEREEELEADVEIDPKPKCPELCRSVAFSSSSAATRFSRVRTFSSSDAT